ncbi:methylmalonyl-CoA epimerase [Candidatus Acetothermia bacterium]|nr:methylmalonyl-CoA epimerase [Candidatus Acetothermia bacterium]MBI3642786.1 methylmalonyl-CoA epimerase [Candidatus Acetothermia bacterium]
MSEPLKLHHVGIVVQELEEAIERYCLLGLKETERGIVEKFDVAVSMIPAGNVKLELMQPLGEGNVQKFLEKRGEGLHHLAFEVKNIEATLAALKSQGVQLIDEVPRPGFGGHRVAFLHPMSFSGLLVELVEAED